MRADVAVGALCVLAALTGACSGDGAAPSLPRAVALSPDGVNQTSQTFSPDGKRVAYWSPSTDSTADWQLWIANADMSSPVKMPATSGFRSLALWSSDGLRLAVGSSEHGASHVEVVTVADGSVQQITQGTAIEWPLNWYRGNEGISYYGTDVKGGIKSYFVPLKTGASALLAPNEQAGVLGARSPDGSHVAYFVIDRGKTTLWAADSTGGNPRQLTTDGFETLEQYQEWSPNGTELLYESGRTGTTDLWVIAVDDGKPRQLTRDVRNDYGGAWSPDGKWIAFLSNRGRQTDIWIVPSAGGVERRLTDDAVEEQQPMSWIPGSHTLTYTTVTEKSSVWALDLANGKERRLTPDSVRVGFFNASPDGKQIDYVVERGGGVEELMVMPLAGGVSRTLVAGAGTVTNPRWSPDGSMILFISDRGGTTAPWVVDAAGGSPRQLVNWPGSIANSATWNSDGTAVYFGSNRDAAFSNVWKVPVAGGEPTRLTTNGRAFNVNGRARVSAVFLQALNQGGGQLSLMRLDKNGVLQPVWNKSHARGAGISPSGDSLSAIVDQPDGKQRSMIIAANGGGGRIVLEAGEQIGDWSNDGKLMLYTMNVGGATELALLNVADGTTRRLTTTPENEAGAEFAPDAKTVIFRRVKTVQRIYAMDLAKLTGGGAKP
jgi:Tol biopolymer transport system component